MKLGRSACNECRVAKEKCSLVETDHPPASCDRCQRLGKPCIAQARNRGGRPRKKENISTVPQPGSQFVWSPAAVRPSDPLIRQVEARDQSFLDIIFRKPSFMESFVLDPAFSQGMREHLFTSLNLAPELLLDAYIACARRFSKALNVGREHETRDIEFANSARAVQALRTASYDVGLVNFLTLGLGIITFDLLTSGLHAHDICRFTLDARTSEHLSAGTSALGLLLPLHFLDAVNCIIHRQLPVAQYQGTDWHAVDQYLGVCGTLLQPFADICNISVNLARSWTPESRTAIFKHLDLVEHGLKAWIPSVPNDFAAIHPPNLTEVIILQGQILRCSLLLICHRLRHPFGSQDDIAMELSREISSLIDLLYAQAELRVVVSEQAPFASFEYRLNFPFLVAAVELTEETERQHALERVSTVVSPILYKNMNEMLSNFLVYIWHRRDMSGHGHWLDWVPDGPPVVLF